MDSIGSRAIKIIIAVLVVFVLGSGYMGYLLWGYLSKEKPNLQNNIAKLESDLQNERDINSDLNKAYTDEKARNDEFSNQIDEISNTVGDLEKLKKLDPELLLKYSKIYFLNENYIPSDLTSIDKKFEYYPEKNMKIHEEVWPYLEDLLNEAESDGLDLKIISAYRSFGEQAIIKSSYNITYGVGTANQFSADQGYSEHQLGTTVDFTDSSVGANFVGFDQTKEYAWLLKNAYKYGFVISYPKTNTYYQFEPWHWRFVGVKLAKALERSDKYFYDMDQRDINKYLLYIFD